MNSPYLPYITYTVGCSRSRGLVPAPDGWASEFPGTFVLDVLAYPAFGVRTTSTDTVQPTTPIDITSRQPSCAAIETRLCNPPVGRQRILAVRYLRIYYGHYAGVRTGG